MSFPQLPFGVRSCQVSIDNLTVYIAKASEVLIGLKVCNVIAICLHIYIHILYPCQQALRLPQGS